jgi:DNA-binding NarL/FixJ family response regulator
VGGVDQNRSDVNPGKKSGVLIVDDQPIAREGLALHVNSQPALQVTGEASTGHEAIRFVLARRPELVIVDPGIGILGGFQLIERLLEARPDLKILVLCSFDEALYAARVLKAGAMGYVSKQATAEEIIDASRMIIRGGRYLSPAMSSRILTSATVGEKGNAPLFPMDTLSNRELEVFRLIGEGHTTRQIAEVINLSVHTIESYREKIKAKLELENSARLSQQATRWVLESCPRGRASTASGI